MDIAFLMSKSVSQSVSHRRRSAFIPSSLDRIGTNLTMCPYSVVDWEDKLRKEKKKLKGIHNT